MLLNSSVSSGHDLWWPIDPKAALGYSVYRAKDALIDWVKLNAAPVPVTYFRDQTRLQLVHYTVRPDAWIDAGEFGQKCLRIPDTPYSNVVKGRPRVAAHPDDVQLQVTYLSGAVQMYRPKMVSGMDRTIWLQVETDVSLPAGGAVSDSSLIPFDAVASIMVIYNKLLNYVDVAANMARTYYTVVPILADGAEEHAPGAPGTRIVDTMQVDNIDYMQKEMVRRNQWLFEQVGEPCYLMFRRTSGERCGCIDGLGKARSACPACYETGIIGGYYGPLDILFIPPDQALVRTIDEGGQKVERRSRSYFSRTPIVQDGDLIIRKNGERLVISGVTYKMPRGVLLQQEFDVALLPTLDTRYLLPIYTPQVPVVYNPAYQVSPGPGAQPVFSTSTMPHSREWDNKEAQIGRTIVFGRIQS